MSIDPGKLFERFLSEQAEAHASGLGTTVPAGLVMPFEDTPFRPLDARGAFLDAVAVTGTFPQIVPPASWPTPPEWSTLLQALEPTADVPFALGNFPQRVQSLSLLLQRRPTASIRLDRPELRIWAGEQSEPLGRLFVAGILRLVGDYTGAAKLLSSRIPAALAALHANEVAALAWQEGNHRKALDLWEGSEPAILFNRGLACLFLGEKDRARTALDGACAALPESNAWHHLASVYRTLVELD